MTATATAFRARDRATGRFRAVDPPSCCAGCGCTLAEDLAGRLYCPLQRCTAYRQPVDVVPGVDLGVLNAADLEPDR